VGAAARHAAQPVVCVVVNWNGWRDTLPCLESLARQDYPALHVIVVDNASTDDSVERIRADCPWVELLESGANRGFAAGCNIGIVVARNRGAEFIWLLNNDTVAPPNTLSQLVASAAAPRTGMVGTVLRYLHRPEQIQAWGGGIVRRWLGYTQHFYAPSPLGQESFLTLASALIRREVFDSVGLLDEGYFMYFEDVDFSLRARAAGWQLTVAPGTAVLHKEGGSAGAVKSTRIDRIVTASGLRFLSKYGRPAMLSQTLFVLSRLAKRLLRGDRAALRAVIAGVRDWRHNQPMAFQEEA
jgi:GT2 family glycosyltransferase